MIINLIYRNILTVDTTSKHWYIRECTECSTRKLIQRRKLVVTESESENKPYKHRIYVGDLTGEEVANLLWDNDMLDRINHTMGAFTERGLMDAVSFRSDEMHYQLNNYISVLPTENCDFEIMEILSTRSDDEKHATYNDISNKLGKILDEWHSINKSVFINSTSDLIKFFPSSIKCEIETPYLPNFG